ncbi:hypothetical protein D9M69_527140 [compost metagenome]
MWGGVRPAFKFALGNICFPRITGIFIVSHLLPVQPVLHLVILYFDLSFVPLTGRFYGCQVRRSIYIIISPRFVHIFGCPRIVHVIYDLVFGSVDIRLLFFAFFIQYLVDDPAIAFWRDLKFKFQFKIAVLLFGHQVAPLSVCG